MKKVIYLICLIIVLYSPSMLACDLLKMLGKPINVAVMMNKCSSNIVSVCSRSVITPANTNQARLIVKGYVVTSKGSEIEGFPFDNPIIRCYTRQCGSDRDEILAEIEVYWQDGKQFYLEVCEAIGVKPLLFSNAVYSASNQLWKGTNNNEVWINVARKEYAALAVCFKYQNDKMYSLRVLCKENHKKLSEELTRVLPEHCNDLDFRWLDLGFSQEFAFHYDTNLTTVASISRVEILKQKMLRIKEKCKRDQFVFQNMYKEGIQFVKDIIVYQEPQSSQKGYYANADASVLVSTRRYNSPIDYETIYSIFININKLGPKINIELPANLSNLQLFQRSLDAYKVVYSVERYDKEFKYVLYENNLAVLFQNRQVHSILLQRGLMDTDDYGLRSILGYVE